MNAELVPYRGPSGEQRRCLIHNGLALGDWMTFPRERCELVFRDGTEGEVYADVYIYGCRAERAKGPVESVRLEPDGWVRPSMIATHLECLLYQEAA